MQRRRAEEKVAVANFPESCVLQFQDKLALRRVHSGGGGQVGVHLVLLPLDQVPDERDDPLKKQPVSGPDQRQRDMADIEDGKSSAGPENASDLPQAGRAVIHVAQPKADHDAVERAFAKGRQPGGVAPGHSQGNPLDLCPPAQDREHPFAEIDGRDLGTAGQPTGGKQAQVPRARTEVQDHARPPARETHGRHNCAFPQAMEPKGGQIIESIVVGSDLVKVPLHVPGSVLGRRQFVACFCASTCHGKVVPPSCSRIVAMAASKQKPEPISPESLLQVIELGEATDLCQAMEARGDFKFKGIFAIFNVILDWTTKFPVNGVLPAMDQLEREVQVPREKLQEYVRELLGRGSSRARLVTNIPAIEFAPGGGGITKMIVFCRPLKGDGPTAQRYVTSYIAKSADILGKWCKTRTPRSGSDYTSELYAQIEQGKLHESQAAPQIASFFYNDLDNSAELRKATYNMITKQVIQKMINDRAIVLIKPAADSFLPTYHGIYFNDPNEMRERFKILAGYFLQRILNNPQAAALDDYRGVLQHAAGFDRTIFGTLQPGAKQVIMELTLMADRLQSLQQEEKEQESRKETERMLGDIANAGLVDLSRQKMDADARAKVRKSPSVLFVEFPYQGRVGEFALHKDAISPAVKIAREHFDVRGDSTDVLVLAEMGVEGQLNPDEQKAFADLLSRVYFEQLPWLIRAWRSLFGGGKLKPNEQEKVKRDMQRMAMEERLRIQKADVRKEQKRLAEERVKGQKQVKEIAKQAVAEKSDGGDGEESPEKVQLEQAAEESLRQICAILDRRWDAGELPGRTQLLTELPQFDENSLIHFLKRHARKEIYSFRVKNEKPEYVWPILITKHYIRKHGRRLYDQAVRDTDAQRAASMPNQEKFDVSSAIEDFLGQLIAKGKN